MKCAVALACFSAVVCAAASMVLFGQYALWSKLTKDEMAQKVRYQTFDTTFNEQLFIKNTLQNQLAEQQKYIGEMEGELDKANLELKSKAADLDFCKGDKTKKDQELSDAEKEKNDAKEVMEKQKAAWIEQSASLKQVKEKPSQICAFIKKDSLGVKLCMAPEVAP